jgi:hypothetical protein
MLVGLCLFVWSDLLAQQDSTRMKLDSLFSELELLLDNDDDLTLLLQLADSLVKLDQQKNDALSIRTGYVSKILSAGRDLGVNQFGAVAGASYYHNSGAFADATSYFNSSNEAFYYMTNFSLGYMVPKWKKWSLSANHSFYFYQSDINSPSFDKSASASLYKQHRRFDVGIDYAYLYGNEEAHRVLFSSNLNLRLPKSKLADRISFYPGASVQLGTNNVYFLRQQPTGARPFFELIVAERYPRLSTEDMRRAATFINQNDRARLFAFLRFRNYSAVQIANLFDAIDNQTVDSKVVFGLMNVSINLPISMQWGNWGFLANYTLNFPIALEGDEFTYPRNGFFTLTVNRTFIFKSKKNDPKL